MPHGVLTHDGIETRIYHWPVERPRCVIQIVHGMAEYAERYERVASFFNANGIAVVAHDHRGHGPQVSDRADLGFFAETNGWQKVIEDIEVVREHFSHSYPDIPWIMLGHSMGSFALRDAIARGNSALTPPSLAGAVVVGTGEWPRMADIGLALTRVIARLAPRSTGHLLNSLVFAGYNRGTEKRTDFDWLCTDPEVVDAYCADPLCGFVPKNQFFADFLGALRRIDAPETFASTPPGLPILLVSGAEDPVGGAEAVESVTAHYRDAGVRQVDSLVYAGKRHEILNETNADAVYQDIVDWINQRCCRGE